VWGKQQACNLRGIATVLKYVMIWEGNTLAKMSEKNSLTLYPEINFNWGKRSCIEFCTRKDRIGIAWHGC
jgi:hypothetical protein